MTAFNRAIRSVLFVGAVALSCGGLSGCKGGGGGSADAGAPSVNTPTVPVANNPQTPAPQTPDTAPAPAPTPSPAPSSSANAPQAPKSEGAMVSWIAPTQNIDGSPLTNLAGYVVSYGRTQDTLSHSVLINNPNVDSASFEDLAPGTYYFAVQAVTANGDLSGLSDLLQKVIS